MRTSLRVIGLASGLLFAFSAFAQGVQPAAPSVKPTAPSVAKPAAKSTTSSELLDINSATKAELDALPGIGEARADAIIKGRPYKGKDELFQKKIVPKNVYDQIKDKIIARQK